MEAQLLTPRQVADRLQITLNTIYVWLREGRLPGVRIGHRWRVRQEALDAFLQDGGDGQRHAGHQAPEADGSDIFDLFADLTEGTPEEWWRTLPRDGAVNHDHYVYGAPKRRPH